MIEKIISGGQTGADRGGLEAAELLGITTGGFAPQGFKTESGCDTSLQTRFGLMESSGGYKERTIENIKASNGTAVFSPNADSPGTQLTLDFCKKLNKPVILVKSKKELLLWINQNNIKVLNIAGNRESVAPGVQERTKNFLLLSFDGFKKEKPIKQLYLDLQEKRIDSIQVKTEPVEESTVEIPDDNFVHLHVHSEFSLLDAVHSVDKLVERAKELGQRAMALTDHGNMFGLYKFQKACIKNGIKPILGVEAYYVDDAEDKEQRSNYHVIILVQTEQGWRNLCKLITNANREGYYYKPRTDRKNLEKYGEGLIILSGCYKSPVSYHFSQEGYDPKKAEENLKFFINTFGDRFYNEVMCIDFPEYDNIVPDVIALADKYGVKSVVTGDVHYRNKGDHKLQSMLLKISTGGKMEGFETQGLFIKSRAEMIRKYITPAMADMTTEIAQRIDFKLNFEGYKFPSFDIESTEDYHEFMKEMKNGFKFLGA